MPLPRTRTADTSTPPNPHGSRSDRIATALLFTLFGFIAIALTHIGPVVTLAADVCGDGRPCDFTIITTAGLLAGYLPLVLLLVTIVVAVIRLLRKRLAFFIPIIGLIATALVLFLANALVGTAISP